MSKLGNRFTLRDGIGLNRFFMKAQDKPSIIQDISRMISRAGEKCSQWRIGVTTDPGWQLFKISMTDPDFQYFSFREALNSREARDIAIAFWNICCEEIPHEMEHPNEDQVFVFAYCKGLPKSSQVCVLPSLTKPWEHVALASVAPDFHLFQQRN